MRVAICIVVGVAGVVMPRVMTRAAAVMMVLVSVVPQLGLVQQEEKHQANQQRHE